MSMSPNVAVSSRNNLLTLLNTTDSKNYTLSNVYFGQPSAYSHAGDTFNNTAITVHGVTDGPYKGQKQLHYRRIAIADIITNPPTFNVDDIVGSTIYTILPSINQLLGLSLRQDELVDASVNLAEDTTLTLTISELSEVWLPGTTVVFPIHRGELPNGTFLGLGNNNILGLGNNQLLGLG